MEFYRYDSVTYANIDSGDYFRQNTHIPNPTLVLRTFNLHKETPKGYWIGYGKVNNLKGGSKWISKDSKKRYAYPTQREALLNFIARNEIRIKILEYQAWDCKIAVSLATQKLNKMPYGQIN